MDELSWQARLARKNINILNVDDERWYYEFMYHPYNGSTKWCKTYMEIPSEIVVPEDKPYNWSKQYEKDPAVIAKSLEHEVLRLRKELEA